MKGDTEEQKCGFVLINLHLHLFPSAPPIYYLICPSLGCGLASQQWEVRQEIDREGEERLSCFSPASFWSGSTIFLAVNALL